MSSSKFPIFLFVIVLLALLGGMFFISQHKEKQPTQTSQTAQTVIPTPTSALPSGTSNAQLDQDTTQIDTSMNALDNDTKAIDQGMNDQQTNLQ